MRKKNLSLVPADQESVGYTMTKLEFSPEDVARRIKEDVLAKNRCGYFKLWRMKNSSHDITSFPANAVWSKDKIVGIFSARGPCEEFLALANYAPEVSYEFCSFDSDIEHIEASWSIELNDDGSVRTERFRWCNGSPENAFCHGKGRWAGYGRSKAEAIASAKEYKARTEEFIKSERPNRATGCYCQPNGKECGPCEHKRRDEAKKICGCPHCKGDHQIRILADGAW